MSSLINSKSITSSCNCNSLRIRKMASISIPTKISEFELRPGASRKIQLLTLTALYSAAYWPMYRQQKENRFLFM